MTDPKRLVEEQRDPALLRALNAGVGMEPPPGTEAAVWTAVSTALAAGAGASVGAASGVPKGLGALGKGLLANKWWWLSTFGIALGGAGGYAALRADSEPAPLGRANETMILNGRSVVTTSTELPGKLAEEIPRVALEDLAPVARSGEVRPTSAPSAEPAAGVAADPSDAQAAATEGELVLGARKALRGGRATEALDLIARARREFPSGNLAQERDALEIDALVLSGAKDSARSRARAFLRRYPSSPYAKNLDKVLR